MRSEFIFGGGEIELIVVHVAPSLEPASGFAFVCDKAVQTRAQISLKTGFAGVVSGEVILFEGVREEALREIFGVFVVSVPFQADVFVCGFPVACDDGVKGATADKLIVAAGVDYGGVIGDREFVKWATDISVRIHSWEIDVDRIYRIFQDSQDKSCTS